MSTHTTAVETPSVAPPPLLPTRPWYWSVRRELWENRWIYVAPLSIAAVLLLGFLISTIWLPVRMNRLAGLEPARQVAGIVKPFSIVASLLILSGFVGGAFYCLEALHGERRDRSLLFWKSLPVSDRTAVLAKLAIPLAVVPLVAMAVTLALQLVMLMASTLVLLASGSGAGLLWSRLPLVQMPLVMVYGVSAHALWFAPLFAWMLFVSAWARRMPLAWVALPPLALGMAEKAVVGSSLVGRLLRWRLLGAMNRAFDSSAASGEPVLTLAQITPFRFVLDPGLWAGLLVAALCVAGAVHFRRVREPN
ncbi:MAG: ABC transporter permease [Vicinamibacteria bacterium]